jgi:hypothetical protein
VRSALPGPANDNDFRGPLACDIAQRRFLLPPRRGAILAAWPAVFVVADRSMLDTLHPPVSLELSDDIVWQHHDLAKARLLIDRPPAPGEVFLWLVPTEFRFASASNIGSWLSVAERRRARLHPNSAIGRRFGVARATLRLVLSHMLGCRPDDVELHEGPDERVAARDPRSGATIGVDVAYSGIWIVIAVSASGIGLGLAVDSAGDDAQERGALWEQAAETGRRRAARDDAAAVRHGLVLPMPGGICGVAALETPVSSVIAFGWERPLEPAARAALL